MGWRIITGWFGPASAVDDLAVAVTEGEPVRVISVAFDCEVAAVVFSVTCRAEAAQVPGVGGAIGIPVDDVVDLQADPPRLVITKGRG